MQQIALLFGEAAGDCGETPVLVRLVELGRLNPLLVQARTELHQLVLIAGSQVDVRGVGLQFISTCVLDTCMCGLNGLLREWDVAARDAI